MAAVTEFMDNAVLLTLKLSTLTNKKTISNTYVTTDADKRFVRANKTLMDAKELSVIYSTDRHIRGYVTSVGIQSYFKSGFYLIPVQQVVNVESYLQENKSKRIRFIEELEQAWPTRLAEAQSSLAELFDPADYVPADGLMNTFGMTWQYIEIAVSNKIKSISSELFKQEQEKAKQTWQNIMEEARQALRGELASLVTDWADRLQNPSDGKTKRIVPKSINYLHEWIDLFTTGGRDLTNDTEIQGYVIRIKKLFNGVDATLLNESPMSRQIMEAKFKQIREGLVPLMENIPRRYISTTDDEL